MRFRNNERGSSFHPERQRANHLIILVVRSMDRLKLTTMLSTFTWGLCYERRKTLLKQISIKMQLINKMSRDKMSVVIADRCETSSTNSLFRTYAKVGVRGRIHNRETIVCGERNGTPANKRKLCIVITTALTRTTNDVGERSCLGEYLTQSNCTGEDCHRDRSPSHISETTGLIPLPPLRAHTARIQGRWQEDRPWLTDVNRFAGSLLAFWGHLLPFRGTSHMHPGDPHERREWEGGAGTRFITYGGAAPFPPFSG